MKHKRRIAMLCGGLLSALQCMPGWADVFVIVNAQNTMQTTSADQLERLFLLKAKRFENGEPAYPVNQDEGARVRKVFNEKVIRRNEQQLKYYWSRKMFSGGDKPPPALGGDEGVEDFVAEKVGAVGYLSKRPSNEQVKVVFVIKE